MKKIFATALFLLLCVAQSKAQTTSWTGAQDTSWLNPLNWTSGIPKDTLDVTIGDASYAGPFQPSLNSSAACRSLTIGSGFVLSVMTNDTIKVGGNLTNNGSITGDSVKMDFVGSAVVLSGLGTAVFTQIRVAPGASFTVSKNIVIKRDLIIEGSFTSVGKTVTFNGSLPSIISGGGSITFGNLVLDKTGTFASLNTPITIQGNLTLTNGVLNTTNANLLTLSDNATATTGNANSFVNGPMKKIGDDAFVFPVGANGVWARVGISAPALTTDAFTAQYFFAAYANTDSMASSLPTVNNVSKIEYWNCERTAGTSNVSVQLFWEDNTRSDITDFSDLVVAHWNGTGWENRGSASVDPNVAGSITSPIQSSFSPFTFGSASGTNPMPIGLLYFNAVTGAKTQVDLDWATVTETNNNYFTVERSRDGRNFEAIATLKGAGTSLVTKYYHTIDAKKPEGTAYYRLKQTDLNGAFSYSGIRTVSFNQATAEMTIFPNPASDGYFNIALQQEAGEEVQVILYSMTGQEIFSKTIVNSDASTLLGVDLLNKPMPGIYTVLVKNSTEVFLKKVVIK